MLFVTVVVNLLVRCKVSELFVAVVIFPVGVCFERADSVFVVAIKLIDV